MKRLVMAAALACIVTTSARADVILDTTGQGGTGTNVIFSSLFDNRLILGKLNGQHDEVVRFRDLTPTQDPLNPFGGSANGNDIKIFNTADLDITVFNSTNLTQLGVTRDIFSIVGTGSMSFHVTMLETDGTFITKNFLGIDLKNGQNGFDFQAINGEKIWDLDMVNVGGTITDFEHYRIDVTPGLAVPGPIVGAGIPGLLAGLFGLIGLGWRRRRQIYG